MAHPAAMVNVFEARRKAFDFHSQHSRNIGDVENMGAG
jgi:hypothetical protein